MNDVADDIVMTKDTSGMFVEDYQIHFPRKNLAINSVVQYSIVCLYDGLTHAWVQVLSRCFVSR